MRRIHLELTNDEFKELEFLMSASGLSTKKDLINHALTLFEWAMKERQAGRIIASVDETSQKYKEIVVPALEKIPQDVR